MCEDLRARYPEDRSPDEMVKTHFPDAEVVVDWLGSGEIQHLQPHGVDKLYETTATRKT